MTIIIVVNYKSLGVLRVEFLDKTLKLEKLEYSFGGNNLKIATESRETAKKMYSLCQKYRVGFTVDFTLEV